MVAAKVRDGGGSYYFAISNTESVPDRSIQHIGPESDTYKRIYEEVQKIMCATLFSPVTRQEAVQATIIIAGWSTDGGWLSLGHAVRMAFEISTCDLVYVYLYPWNVSNGGHAPVIIA